MRAQSLLGALALTTCFATQTVVVTPQPVVQPDSMSRSATAGSAMTLLEKIASEDSVGPSDVSTSNGHRTECFESSNLRFCGTTEDAVMTVFFIQRNSKFYGRGDQTRRDVIRKLQSAYGEQGVRECKQNWLGRQRCRPVRLDSAS